MTHTPSLTAKLDFAGQLALAGHVLGGQVGDVVAGLLGVAVDGGHGGPPASSLCCPVTTARAAATGLR